MSEVNSHRRVNDILFGPLERPALRWLAAHMPAWMNPDILTLIGIGGAVMIFAGYVLSNAHPGYLWLANLGFVVNWFGDSLDGTLARYRHIERPKYGYFVDHTVDAFSQLLIFAGLGLTPFVRFEIAAAALVGYLLMSVFVYVNTFVSGVFKISYGRLGPTEMRALAILINVYLFLDGNRTVGLPIGDLTVVELIVIGLALLFLGGFLGMTIRRAAELARLGE
jgi:phosphatidylglycerophosphate synthase